MAASIIFSAFAAMFLFSGGFVLGASGMDTKINNAGFRDWALVAVSLAAVGAVCILFAVRGLT